ncbi:MAG: NADH-quinone oxidoreductase subunit H [Phycisphaerales bacterium]|nr:NADH-quinone oxidoreductase subunit H [Phycisphaerales bacterium]
MDFIKDTLADQFWFSIILSLAIFGGIMTAVAYCILLERKVSAWIQDRYGPNRVGPKGLLQPLADGVKLLFKEDIVPGHIEKTLFILAPFISFVVALIGFAVIPWGGAFRWPWMAEDAAPLYCQVATIDIGLLYILAVASLGVYGVVLGGWASNNKYAFYGGIRAAAQMLSYEIPLAMMVLVGILTTRSLRLEEMVTAQLGVDSAAPMAALFGLNGFAWTLFYHPLAAVILFITALAEANRAPFDLAECEQELIGGFHTEYSGMKWALFFLGEYAHMITSSAFMIAIFFGGYCVPGWTWLNTSDSVLAMLLRGGVFSFKILLFIMAYMVVRWTLPRFRFDQLMQLAWKSLVPIGGALVLLQVWILYKDLPQWVSIVGNVTILAVVALIGVVVQKPITGRQRSLIKKERIVRMREALVQRG